MSGLLWISGVSAGPPRLTLPKLDPAELSRIELVIDQALRAYDKNDLVALRKVASPGSNAVMRGRGWPSGMLSTYGRCKARVLVENMSNSLTVGPPAGFGVAHLVYKLTFEHGTGRFVADFVQQSGTWYIDELILQGDKAP
jgi:hypothetical protein